VSALPNHLTPMAWRPANGRWQPGAGACRALRGRGRRRQQAGQRPTPSSAGIYGCVKHEFSNQSAAAITPQLYLQLARDGNPPEGESSFYFTFTGPAVYTEASKFQKIDSRISPRAAQPRQKAATRWVAMVQHYFASAWLAPVPGPRESAPPGVPTTTTPWRWCCRWARSRPGAVTTHDATLFAGPQEENKLAALAAGLELVKDYGWFTVLSKPFFCCWTSCTIIGNWGWAIVALVVLLKIASTGSTPAPTAAWPR